MKKHLIFLFTSLLLLNCSNNDDGNNLLITGNWNWLESSGGIDGRTETPESTGNIIKLEITSNTIKRFVNGTLDSELNYTIELGESTIIGGEHEMIVYENDSRQTIVRTDNLLILYEECSDCFQHHYIRE